MKGPQRRLLKAARLFLDGRVRWQTNDEASVQGDHGSYRVVRNIDGTWVCPCPFGAHQVGGDACSHVMAACYGWERVHGQPGPVCRDCRSNPSWQDGMCPGCWVESITIR